MIQKKLGLYLFCCCLIGIGFSHLSAQSYNTNFDQGDDGWIGSAIGYPIADQNLYQLAVHWNAFHHPQQQKEKGGLLFKGKNLSGNLFLYSFKQISHLEPNALYKITFNTLLYSFPDSQKVNGKLYIKGGSLNKLPVHLYMDELVANFDKGKQGTDGKNMYLLDSIELTSSAQKYVVQNYLRPFIGRTNSKGELYLILGIEPSWELKQISPLFVSALRATFSYQEAYTEKGKATEPFSLYLLPNKEGFYFDTDWESDLAMISIYSSGGHLIQVMDINRPFYEHIIKTSDLSPGLYQVIFTLQNGEKHLKEIHVRP